VISQKINSLEEKINVMDTFTQSIFNYISAKEEESIKQDQDREERKRKEVQSAELKPNQEQVKQEQVKQEHVKQVLVEEKQDQVETEVTYSNQLHVESNDTEQENYNIHQPINQFEDKLTENFESKEILSEMVSQLKETLIQENKESLQQDLDYVSELKEELNSKKEKDDDEDESKPADLFNLLNSTFNAVEKDKNKKKEEELMSMKISDLKELAKKKNIRVLDQSKKPKKKEALVMELLNQS
jgi:hypothetical protein